MRNHDFDDPEFLKQFANKAGEILKQVRSDLLNDRRFKILTTRYFEPLWRKRSSNDMLISLVMAEAEIEKINLKEINSNFEDDIFEAFMTNNIIYINHSLQVISSKTQVFRNSSEAKIFLKQCSNEGNVVIFFGPKGIDNFIRGENLGEINNFYCVEDVQNFSEKFHISQIKEVIRNYEQMHLSNQGQYMVFFAEKSLLNRIDTNLVKRNILRNKPEKLMRDNLKTYLNQNMKHTFVIENELSATKRELDISTEVNGEYYFIEIKWIGQSVSDCGTKLGTSYTDSRARDGVTQALEYIEELSNKMDEIRLRTGYLVVFDARDNDQNIDYKNFDFIKIDLKKFKSRLDVIPAIRLKKTHSA